MDFSTKFNALVARAESALGQAVPADDGAGRGPDRIHEAMRYSLGAGGKRIRPVMVLAAAELCGAALDEALPAAAAIECVHTYSLVHDDLPCMDDDDLRRGRPTVHKQFDEATALLAGDALLTQAFLILSTRYAHDPALANALVRVLAHTAGGARLIGGQMADLLAEKKPDPLAAELDFIHLNKTAAMIETSLEMGGLVGGADEPVLRVLRTAGRHLGLAFQIVDDILDATADSATLGKTAGKDARDGKMTYVSFFGLEGARARAAEESARAVDALRSLPGDTTFLTALFARLLDREK